MFLASAHDVELGTEEQLAAEHTGRDNRCNLHREPARSTTMKTALPKTAHTVTPEIADRSEGFHSVFSFHFSFFVILKNVRSFIFPFFHFCIVSFFYIFRFFAFFHLLYFFIFPFFHFSVCFSSFFFFFLLFFPSSWGCLGPLRALAKTSLFPEQKM